MDHSIIVTTSRECGSNTDSIVVLDLETGTSALGAGFRGNMSGSGAVCLVGGPSSYSGHTAAGVGPASWDYMFASQMRKPAINMYQWGKPQPVRQLFVQEITSVLACDAHGQYLAGGTQRGFVYLWEVATGRLVESWSAHHAAITRIAFHGAEGGMLVTAAADGHLSAWNVCEVVDASTALYGGRGGGPQGAGNGNSGGNRRRHISPWRSWCPHSLPVTSMLLLPAGCGTSAHSPLRVLSAGLDGRIVLHDVYAGAEVFTVDLASCVETATPGNDTASSSSSSSSSSSDGASSSPVSTSVSGIHSLACDTAGDHVYCGCGDGNVYVLSLSVMALGLLKAETSATALSLFGSAGNSSGTGGSGGNRSRVAFVFTGHRSAVTSLSVSTSSRGTVLCSGSADGSLCMWDVLTRKCRRRVTPFGSGVINVAGAGGKGAGAASADAASVSNVKPISNIMVCVVPDYVSPSTSMAAKLSGNGALRPTLTPCQPLRKYANSANGGAGDGADAQSAGSPGSVAQLDPLSLPLRIVGMGIGVWAGSEAGLWGDSCEKGSDTVSTGSAGVCGDTSQAGGASDEEDDGTMRIAPAKSNKRTSAGGSASSTTPTASKGGSTKKQRKERK